jgi:hypothetical protein
MPGNKVGPFAQGLRDRWNLDTDQREGICYSQYTGNRMRVVTVPIVDDFSVNGKKCVKVVAFAAFFLQSKPTGGGDQNLKGEFIYDVLPGEPGGPQNSKTYVVHLIQ